MARPTRDDRNLRSPTSTSGSESLVESKAIMGGSRMASQSVVTVGKVNLWMANSWKPPDGEFLRGEGLDGNLWTRTSKTAGASNQFRFGVSCIYWFPIGSIIVCVSAPSSNNCVVERQRREYPRVNPAMTENPH